MQALPWIGIALTVVGILGIIGCIIAVARAKKAGLSDDDLRAKLQKIVAWNLGALAISAIGLMTLIMGLMLQ